jgi:phosphoribosyl 1,2-cyclic phosphodiesterase
MLKSGPYPLQLQKRILSAHGHLSNDDCAQTILKLKEDGCSKFLLAHLSKHNNTPQLALQTVRSLLNDDTIFLYACPEAGDDLLEF